MYDLLSFKEQRIIALLAEVDRLRLVNEKYSTMILELCDKDCTVEYKSVIINEVWGTIDEK